MNMYKQVKTDPEKLVARLKYVAENASVQDEKDCRDIAKLQDEIHHLVIGLNKAKRRNDLPYIDTLKSEIKSREKRLEKLRSF